MKTESPAQGSAEEAGSPKECAKSIRIRQSLQKHLGRPVPCEQGAADLRRKRQPAAHAVPSISEAAEKSVKYMVFV